MRTLVLQKKSSVIFFALLFITLGTISYWPSFFGERIWDDHFLIGSNPFFRSPLLAWECFQHWMYPFYNSTYFRPMQHVSYMLDYWFWGEELFGYHLTNVLIHAGAAFLLGFLIRRIAKAFTNPERSGLQIDLLAFGTAVLWLVHPIHHAGVAYISGRADSLAALFSIGSWLLCERGWETRHRSGAAALFLLAALSGWLALCSKEIALTWFGLFTLYQVAFRLDRPRLQRLLPVIGAGVLVLLYAFHRKNLPQMAVVESNIEIIPASLADRFVLMFKALGDYVSLIFCPVNLHLERTLTLEPGALATGGAWLKLHSALILPLGIVALAFAIWLFLRRSPNGKLHRFAVCWFFLGFLPISNLFPLNAEVAEHWIYMASIPMLLLIVKGVLAIPLPRPEARPALIGVFCAVLVVLTHEQSRYWTTEENFLRTTIARGGDTPRIRSNLARLQGARGDLQAAEAVIRESLKKNPEADMLRSQLAGVLRQQRRSGEAAKVTASAPVRTMRPPIPWLLEEDQILALRATKREAEAQELLTRSLATWPLAWELVQLQSAIHERAGNTAKAIEVLNAYVNQRWWHSTAVMRLARVLTTAGKYDEAIEVYKKAARLDIRASEPFERIVAIHLRQKHLPEALLAQANAVDRTPDSLVQRERLAQIYEALGRHEEASIERMIFPRLRLEAQQ